MRKPVTVEALGRIRRLHWLLPLLQVMLQQSAYSENARLVTAVEAHARVWVVFTLCALA